MSLERLQISNIRNIVEIKLDLHPHLNLFIGPNGSGKTSLLEAVYFLGSGRSFRSNQILPLVTRGKEDCTVFGSLVDEGVKTQLGVHRSLIGRRSIKINGLKQMKSSGLAKELPVLELGPETVDLVTGSPGNRRRFLNWGVFHVEQDFAGAWDAANRCLKQRNQLLRHPLPNRSELATWTQELAEHGERIHQYRLKYCSKFIEVFKSHCLELSGLSNIKCIYQKGWDSSKSLMEVYESQIELDIKRSYTQSGFHRADIKITIEGQAVSSVCSRGELKILAWALLLSQGSFLSMTDQRRLVYLVDDLPSELDEKHRANICNLLKKSKGQVLATGIDAKSLQASWGAASRRVFHVERGTFSLEEIGSE